MRRRIVLSLAAAGLTVTLVGCGGGDSVTPNDVQPSPSGGASVSQSPGPRTSGENVDPSGAPG